MIIIGNGEAFSETGTEGIYWSVLDEDATKTGYDKVYVLEDGDDLTIYDREDPRVVRWHGVIELEYETHKQRAAGNCEYVAQAIFGRWIRGLQRGTDAEMWAIFFFEAYPMRLERGS